jgi:arylsulfatase A-like enzyme
LTAIRKHGIEKNTLVLFTNDNGGAGKTSSGPLRGHKFGPKYEGHMRVPTLAWWPGKIPRGSVSSEIMATIDLLPTIASLAGQPIRRTGSSTGMTSVKSYLGRQKRNPHMKHFSTKKDGSPAGKVETRPL